ncbi:MAG TPA: amidohydrolase family protein, partial [Gemmatimonadaceae bacterium]|nr:amidohydrolase family protein [Gemmatimonadaceae bacterium]
LINTELLAQRAASADTTQFVVLFSDHNAGHLKVWKDGSETVSDYEYNDRGRGPRIVERYATNPDGYLTDVSIIGHNYYKDSVDEHYNYQNGIAHWKNHVEGQDSARGPITFYSSLDGTPAETDPLLEALFKAGGKPVALFPTGDNTIAHDRDLTITAPGRSPMKVSLYSISGSGLSPFQVWLDSDRHFFGYVSAWTSTIRDGWQSAAPAMVAAQDSVAAARFQILARTLAHHPTGALVFRNANMFDSEHARMMPHMTVVISGNRIQSVAPDATARVPANAEVIDAAGKALLPGLWDMHVHISPGTDGLMHLAAGVTTARDMGNDTSVVLALRKKFNDGVEIGPRLVLAGLIDSPGPYQVPIGLLASTESEARAVVDRYADLGFEQIKIYSSLKPELVPPIVAEAHKRGLRVSGHVPAFMTAEQVVRLGFDEVQHVNFLVLNFIDSVKDTRAMSRFTAVGNDAATLDLSSPRVRAFIQLLKDRHIVSDPTVGAFEDMFVARAGTMSPNMAAVADRLPPQVRRYLFSGGLPVTAANDQRYRDSYDAMLKLVDELYKAGVTIVAGTDGWPGFGLDRELELDVRAGIPPAEVLRMATLTAARVTRHDNDRGSITPGKLADVILVDGDPATNIGDIRNVRTVVKDGVVFQSAELYRAIAIKPQ